jgi:hypothetical protein
MSSAAPDHRLSPADAEKGRTTRAAQAVVWAAVRTHQLTVHAVLTEGSDTEALLDGRRVKHLLNAVPGWGAKKIAAVCADAGVNRDHRWRALGHNQKTAIRAALPK